MSETTTKTYKNFIINNKVYDLSKWIPIHPGGPNFFLRANGRDITAAVYTYHENP